ncbi:MAG: hypothetical protein KGL71_06395 [Xanthomonadaceae bacterium]|nr:hypothetical protein [Xanthomonadaceae bacterium]
MSFDVPSLHDAQLVGVCVSASGDKLTLSMVDGDLKYSLFLGGVRAFRLVDMQIQNIICNLGVHSGFGVSENKLRGLLEWVSSGVETTSYMTDEAISRYVDKIERGELALVVIEPSAGAELSVLCETVEYRTKGTEQRANKGDGGN